MELLLAIVAIIYGAGVVSGVVGALLGLGAAARGRAWLDERRAAEQRRVALRALPFTSSPDGFRAEVDGQVLRYDRDRTAAGGEWLGVEIPPRDLEIRPRSLEEDEPSEAERVGDPSIDRRFHVRGDAFARAWLTEDVRWALSVLESEVEVGDGVVWVRRARFDPDDVARLTRIGRLFAAQSPDPAVRLRFQLGDSVPWVRMACLRALGGQDRALARALAADVLGDRDAEVRCWAALLVGDAGVLATLAGSREVAEDTRVEAATGVERFGSTEQRWALGMRMARDPSPRIRSAGVDVLQHMGAADALEGLVPSADPDLLAALARALARCGTVTAVPVLRARREQTTLLQRALADTLDRAVRELQERSGGERGSVSVPASSEARGAVSVALPGSGLQGSVREERGGE